MGSYITTYTGLHFEPTNPAPEKIRIEDIAHALPLICRGNGHVKSFWSVGEHCLLCAKEARARGFSARVQLACLLHDASECYLSDIPRPFKQALPAYREREEALLSMIYVRFLGSPLTAEEEEQLSRVDDDVLWYDLDVLLEKQETPPPALSVMPDYAVRAFSEVEAEYLERFRELTKELRPN